MKAILALMACFLVGCASAGRKVDFSKTDNIQKGQTTEQEIRSEFGEPQSVGVNSEGERVLTYEYQLAKPKASAFIPVVGGLTGGYSVDRESLQVTIATDGTVREYVTSTGQVEGGMIRHDDGAEGPGAGKVGKR